MEVGYRLVNPGNEHLSSDHIPNKAVFLSFLIIWSVASLSSLAYIIYLKVWKANFHKFYFIMILILVVMTFSVLFEFVYWVELSEVGAITDIFQYSVVIKSALMTGLQLIIINLLWYGYKITKPKIQCHSFLKNIILTTFIVISTLIYDYSKGFIIMIVLITLYVILIMLLKMDIKSNTRELENELQNLPAFAANDESITSAIKFKKDSFKRYICYLYVILSCKFVVLIFGTFFSLYNAWVYSLLLETWTVMANLYLFTFLNFPCTKKLFDLKYKQLEEPVNPRPEMDPSEMPIDFPLPFRASQNLKIRGDLIIVETIDDGNEDIPSVGVEWTPLNPSHSPTWKRDANITDDSSKPRRARIYEIADIERQAKQDINKILNNSVADSVHKYAQNLFNEDSHESLEEEKIPDPPLCFPAMDSEMDHSDVLKTDMAFMPDSNLNSLAALDDGIQNLKLAKEISQSARHNTESEWAPLPQSFLAERVIDFRQQEAISNFHQLAAQFDPNSESENSSFNEGPSNGTVHLDQISLNFSLS